MPSISTEIPNGQRAHPDRRPGVRAALRARRPRRAGPRRRSRPPAARRTPGSELTITSSFTTRLHAVELADLGLQAREQVDDRQRRGRLAGRDVDLAAELALVDELAVLVGAVPGDEDDVADRDRADVVARRRGSGRGARGRARRGALRGSWHSFVVGVSEACRGRRRARSRRSGRSGARRPRRACSCSRTRGWG